MAAWKPCVRIIVLASLPHCDKALQRACNECFCAAVVHVIAQVVSYACTRVRALALAPQRLALPRFCVATATDSHVGSQHLVRHTVAHTA